jgi:hypothetical protein
MAATHFNGPVVSQNGFIVGSGATINKVLTATATLDFPSISAVSQASLTISVPGAAVGDEVIMSLPAAPAAGLVFNAFVSAADTVTVRATNVTAAPVDAASASYGVIVLNAA